MSSTKKCIIKIDEDGPSIVSNGDTVASDLRLTLKDYLPSVTNWTTWNGSMKKGDEIAITTPYKFIAVRARNSNTSTGSTIKATDGSIDLTSACLPANNSLASNCGCNAGSTSTTEVLLDFEMNQFTSYALDTKTIYSDNALLFDCSHGPTASGVTGWSGCTCIDVSSCGGTGATSTAIGITGATGTCSVGGATAVAKGVYNYSFTGYLKNNNLVIKSSAADNEYKCKLDYYAYTKVDNEYILFIFNDTLGKWVIVKLDKKINDIVQNKTAYNIIELIEWSETNYIYKNSNISMPSAIGYTSTNINSFTGTVSELDSNMPVTFKMNSLFIMESANFKGKITAKVNNLDVNIMLAI